MVIDNSNISEDNVIIGLASFGKSTYEAEYNSGIGSNGLTSARHDIFSKYISKKYPESYDPEISDNLVYSGSKKLTDKDKNMSADIGKIIIITNKNLCPSHKKNNRKNWG